VFGQQGKVGRREIWILEGEEKSEGRTESKPSGRGKTRAGDAKSSACGQGPGLKLEGRYEAMEQRNHGPESTVHPANLSTRHEWPPTYTSQACSRAEAVLVRPLYCQYKNELARKPGPCRAPSQLTKAMHASRTMGGGTASIFSVRLVPTQNVFNVSNCGRARGATVR